MFGCCCSKLAGLEPDCNTANTQEVTVESQQDSAKPSGPCQAQFEVSCLGQQGLRLHMELIMPAGNKTRPDSLIAAPYMIW